MRRLGALRGDAGGAILVEFACVLPVLLMLYMAAFVLSDELAAGRKVTITARTITDLVTRYGMISTDQTRTALAASAQILVPYSGDTARARVSEVLVTGATTGRVMWSVVPDSQTGGTAMPALAACSVVTLPSGMATVGTYLVLGEVNITYHPVVGLGATTDIKLSDHSAMSPRNVTVIPLDGLPPPTCS